MSQQNLVVCGCTPLGEKLATSQGWGTIRCIHGFPLYANGATPCPQLTAGGSRPATGTDPTAW